MLDFSVSVVIAVLNNESGIRRALLSVINQTYPVEIIVIDGGSDDGTLEVISEFESFISYFETGLDDGIADAFNRGLSHANGKFIAILNSDDYWSENVLHVLHAAVRQNPLGDVYCGAVQYSDEAKNYKYVRLCNVKQLVRRMSVFHPSIFIANAAYKRVGLYNKEYTHAMDSNWVHRAVGKGLVFVEINSVFSIMALNGLSDREYTKSLLQYKKSLVETGLATPIVAHTFYMASMIIRFASGFRMLRFFKELIDKAQLSKLS